MMCLRKFSKRGIEMVLEFKGKPIVLGVNPHTNKQAGDDSGYRGVPVSSLDADDPDLLVSLLGTIPTSPVYIS